MSDAAFQLSCCRSRITAESALQSVRVAPLADSAGGAEEPIQRVRPEERDDSTMVEPTASNTERPMVTDLKAEEPKERERGESDEALWDDRGAIACVASTGSIEC